jgi:leucyl-tRNA synthetase
MKALRDIYQLKIDEPFKQLFTQGMITHRTYQDENKNWVMPKDVAIQGNHLIHLNTKSKIYEGQIEKMSKSKKNVIEPDDILQNYGIDATRLFMISDSPPDRELEWTDEGIQSSKNLVFRIERYFEKDESKVIDLKIEKEIEKFIFNIEENILNFSLNKCIANIYTLFNFLEKSKVYSGSQAVSRKILICIFPIIPKLSKKIYQKLFKSNIEKNLWPEINKELLKEEDINLPIQVKGKFVTTIETNKGYKQEDILKTIYQLTKIKSKIENKKIIKVINVQDKIINIITD